MPLSWNPGLELVLKSLEITRALKVTLFCEEYFCIGQCGLSYDTVTNVTLS